MRSTRGKLLRLPPFEEGFPSIVRSKDSAKSRLGKILDPLEADIPDFGRQAGKEAESEEFVESLDWAVADCSWERLEWPEDKADCCRPVEIESREDCIWVNKWAVG